MEKKKWNIRIRLLIGVVIFVVLIVARKSDPMELVGFVIPADGRLVDRKEDRNLKTDQKFKQALRKLFEYEGKGLSNLQYDRGGPTKFGISRRSYPELDIVNLTLQGATEIYKRDFWDKLRLGEVEDEDFSQEIFEQSVNFGTRIAARFTQRALLTAGKTVKIDGIIGSETIKALNSCRDLLVKEIVLKRLNCLQLDRYWSIVKRDPSQRRWMRGWVKRVEVL